jgi:Protein of unknown function (DUF1353)
MKTKLGTVLVVVLSCLGAVAGAEDSNGHFVGEVVATLLPDGRNLKLVQDFGYIDPRGKHWDVPSGTETDGASVPQAFWVAFPPFTGKYRQAAVVHDRYCQTKERPWKTTHKVFYDAMITAGVDEMTAKVLYGAVYYMGPRWGFGAQTRGPGAAKLPSEQQQLEFMDRLQTWIKRENPTPTEIAAAMEAGRIP